MPSILRLHLIPRQDIPLRMENGPSQGWFLALARNWDPSWAEILHGGNQRSAYTVSPLHYAAPVPLYVEDSLTTDRRACGLLRSGEPISLRISLADDEKVRGLLAALPTLSLPPLEGVPCRLTRFPRATESDPDWFQATWANLVDAPPAKRLQVSFESPTAFSHRGESLLLPDPARLLDAWRRAWEYAPALPAGAGQLTAEGLRVTAYNLHTEPLSLKRGLRIGFVGQMELTWRPGTPEAPRRAFTAMARLADFLGTGAKTALGMGQTRVRVMDEK